MARVVITGVAGQDGVLLAEQLLARGDEVFGTTRGDPLEARSKLSVAAGGVQLRELDLRDARRIDALIADLVPDQIYHLAAPSQPNIAWQSPAEATDALCCVPARILEAVQRRAPRAPHGLRRLLPGLWPGIPDAPV